MNLKILHESAVTVYPYPAGHARYRLTRDGVEVMVGPEQSCWAWLHRTHSASVAHCLRYEGYVMEPAEAPPVGGERG